MQIETSDNNIIFQFVEDVTSGRFINQTNGPILVSVTDTNQTNAPRWGKVTHVGPKVLDVKIGEYILIEPGKWTSGFYIDRDRYWKTDEGQILAVSDEPQSTY